MTYRLHEIQAGRCVRGAMPENGSWAFIRKDVRKMPDNEREVLTDLLMLMDTYDLYGRMAIPKRHDFESEVPELYRIAADTEVQIRHLDYKKDSLQDIFLKAMENGNGRL